MIEDKEKQQESRNIVVAAKGGTVVFVCQIITNALRFVTGVIIARLLGAEPFSLYGLGMSFANLQSSFTLLGLQGGVVRHIPLARTKKDNERLWGVIQVGVLIPSVLSVILSIVVFFWAEEIVMQFFNNNTDMIPVLQIMSFQILFFTLIVMGNSLLQGFKQVGKAAYGRLLIPTIAKLILVAMLLPMGFGLYTVLIIQLITSVIGIFLLFYFLHQSFSLLRPFRITKLDVVRLLRFSLPLYFSRLLSNLGGNFETLILGYFGMTTGVGIFIAAGSISGVSNLFHISLANIAQPLFAELHTKNRIEQLKSIYQVITRWAISFSLPFFLTMIFFGKPLLLIFGKEFQAGSLPLIIMASGSLFNAATGQCGSMINMIGKSKISAMNSLLYLLVTIVLDFALIPTWEVEGAALAASLTVMFINFLRMVEVYYFLRILPFNISILKPVGASIIAGAVTFVVNQQLASTHLIIQTAVGIILIWSVYAVAIILFKFSPEDHLILKKLVGRFKLDKYIKLK